MKALILSVLVFAGVQVQAAAPAGTKSLSFTQARIFAPLKGTNATAGYGIIKNETSKAVSVTLNNVDGFKATELHETTQKDGKMKMSKVDKITIPAQGTFEMKPGGHHIMLFDATREMKDGDTLAVQFLIDGKKESYDFKVVPRVPAQESEHHHHH